MPTRPDVKKDDRRRGKAEGRIGGSNSWPIDMLQKGDVYVADGMGKIVDGTLIGDNLGNSIFAKSGNGVVFDGSVRDIEGLGRSRVSTRSCAGGTVVHPGGDADRDQRADPDRRAICLPGDVVLAKREGVLFIPAHLAERSSGPGRRPCCGTLRPSTAQGGQVHPRPDRRPLVRGDPKGLR